MEIYQVENVMNSIIDQAIGRSAVANLPQQAYNSISRGDDTVGVDAIYSVLLDIVGDTIISMRPYDALNVEMRRNAIEWGSVLRKISYPLTPVVRNTSWTQYDEPYNDPFAKSKNKPIQKIFNKISTWEVDGTIYDRQLTTAFANPTDFYAFMNAILLSLSSSMELAYEQASNICRAFMIASMFPADGVQSGGKAVNLLAEYNTAFGATLTVQEALVNSDFLAYAASVINLYSNRMRVMSETFNDGTIARHTPKDYQVLTILDDFNAKLITFMRASTFHETLITMPNFTTIPFWQGSGKDWAWEDVSAIRLLDGENNAIAVENVVGVLYDWERMGTTINRRRTTSQYNPRDEYTNYFMKADIGFYDDWSENAVVFYLDENTAESAQAKIARMQKAVENGDVNPPELTPTKMENV